MPVWLILLVTALYMAGLFAIAWRRDRAATREPGPPHPMVYALALAVYCTSWTYFGAVGTAAASGWDYLPIYLGPALVFLFMPGLVRRIGDVAHRESVTSLSDFLSARYGKSRLLAAVATLAAVTGSLPYIALQLKAVGMSVQALASSSGNEAAPPGNELVLLTAVALAVFAILFGARHSDNTRYNAGLMRVLAFEALVKLGALVAVCLLSIALLGRPDLASPVTAADVFPAGSPSGRFITITLLSMAAILCLPRQFHVAMIERQSELEATRARWVFPLYMLATSLVVIPITLAGLNFLPNGASPDLFVLNLPLSRGHELLALAVFLGGFSAATGMVIVSTVTLSTMVTNDLLVPALMRAGRFDRLGGNAGARLTTIRRTVIVSLLLLSYAYYRLAGSGEALAQIGLLSFAAAAQFAPALIAAVYWKGGRRDGAVAGLIAGVALWAYTLFLPALAGAETLAGYVPAALHPHRLFGNDFGDSLTHGVVWSLAANILLFVGVSLNRPERLRDRIQAAAFVGAGPDRSAVPLPQPAGIGQATPDGLKALAMRFLGEEAVEHAFADLAATSGITTVGARPADWQLVQRTERLLASALGASSARVVLASAIGGVDVALPDVLSMLDHRTQAERFDRHMLQSMLENIPQGISVVDHNQRLVAWNSAYIDLFDYPFELLHIGRPIADLIAHNMASGWISGDPAQQASRRIEYMRAGRPHAYERQNPDGRYLRITGAPMPGGGYVTTFTDITEDRLRQQALVEANETLEARVRERTQALERLTEDLDAARQDAEGANASKTRFLAAASHDLLQPLNAARLFLGALKSGAGRSNDGAEDLINRTDKAIQSADELLKGLLDISRLDHATVAPQPCALPLGPLFEDLADEAEPMVARAGLTLRIAPTGLAADADPDFLKSILRNFLSNARRYTREGGVLIGARRRGGRVRIEVWDTGPGIAPERLDIIFEEFRRFEDADNLGVRGAGLGLSVARRLASLMDAELGVRSVPGRGSVFSITLPRAETRRLRVPALQAAPHRSPGSLTGLRVACIDDDPSILAAMNVLLSAWGCRVTVAATPGALAAGMAGAPFDVLIADYKLEGAETGLELIARHRLGLADPGGVALLTANTELAVAAAAHSLDVTVLHKPVSPDVLRGFLDACAARRSAQAAE
ncbi:PAS-domain containing protein [Hyphomonas sp.]|uniref:hybrid sensor histidine kinase/response regulator n=1 Tax=Hyphomonas sp. TaxID=87 RepID=UPI00391D170F